MSIELLTPNEMAEADRRTIAAGPYDGMALMRRAGAAVADAALARFPGARRVHVLCGPGNNGGDGYVAAAILAEAGVDVVVWASGPPRAASDASQAAVLFGGSVRDIAEFDPAAGDLVIDALYGAGLSKPVEGVALDAIRRTRQAGCAVLAVDLPSGVSGASGAVLGDALAAAVTVTFARRKPGHLLYPGRGLCGEVAVADIGIPDSVIAEVAPRCAENGPALWHAALPQPSVDTYKYRRGHVGVFSGGPAATGAARLAAMGAARAGAGAVTLLSPGNAVAVNAAHLTSIILRRADSMEEVRQFLDHRKPQALVYGPGLGPHAEVGEFAVDLIRDAIGQGRSIVLDADALTSLGKQADSFFAAAGAKGAPTLVLTPHEGEFGRLFPDLAQEASLSKPDRAREAARRANAVMIFKGPDTVIAAPDGRAAINSNGTPLLATAGSGDVLGGIAAGLLAQDMPAFEAACAAVWIHAEAAANFGPGLMAEDLPGQLPKVLRRLTRAAG